MNLTVGRESHMRHDMTRRQFISSLIGCTLCGACAIDAEAGAPIYRGKEITVKDITDLPRAKGIQHHSARYWRPVGRQVQCTLCPKFCMIDDGQTGACRVRVCYERKLYTKVYGLACAVSYHPVEQTPIFHVVPGMRCLGIATAGCNLRCLYCQNWQISQVGPEQTKNYDLPPSKVVELAKELECGAIAYTFTEPVIFFEYAFDTAKLAKEHKLKNLMVTAGYIDDAPLRELCKLFDCIRIDLKGFSEDFYRTVVGGSLKPVLRAIELVHQSGTFMELVVLVVPTMNDSQSEIKRMCQWVVKNLGQDVPIHFLRFYPSYRLRNLPPTPIKTLELCRDIAMEAGVRFAYIGNVPGHDGENTYCPRCNRLLVKRVGYIGIAENNLNKGKCKFCGESIPGVWA